MSIDPIVQEVHSVRKEIEQRYPDAGSFHEQMRQEQKPYGDRLMRCHPKDSPRTPADSGIRLNSAFSCLTFLRVSSMILLTIVSVTPLETEKADKDMYRTPFRTQLAIGF
jgi:hypothetical protein